MSMPPRATARYSATLVAVGSSLAVVAAFCLPGAVGSARADDCGGGAVVVVGGTNDPEAASMVGVEQRYTGRKPVIQDGETVIVDDPTSPYYDDPNDPDAKNSLKVIRVDYPTTLWPLGALGYDESVADGEAATKKAIATYQSECPGKPVVVTGYSQGARVAGDVLSDIGNDRVGKVDINGTDDTSDDVEIQKYLLDDQGNQVLDSDGHPIPIISGELYSDPRRDGTVDGEGVELALPGIFPGLTMSGSREGGFGDVPVTTVCVDGDGICDVPDPVHDPIGAIDALVGYFTKHGYYPYQMWLDPYSSSTGTKWGDTTCETAAGSSTTTCEVHQDSAIVGVIRQGVDAIGLDGSQVPDFLADRWKVDLPYGAKLANLQPLVLLVQDQLPPLPYLGYGGYLPDVFVFEDILDGIVNNAPDEVKAGVQALAASAKSIVLIPANFVKYWAGEIIGPVTTTGTTPVSAFAATADLSSDSSADQRDDVVQRLAVIEHPGDAHQPAVDGSAAERESVDPSPTMTQTVPAGQASDTTPPVVSSSIQVEEQPADDQGSYESGPTDAPGYVPPSPPTEQSSIPSGASGEDNGGAPAADDSGGTTTGTTEGPGGGSGPTDVADGGTGDDGDNKGGGSGPGVTTSGTSSGQGKSEATSGDGAASGEPE